MRKINTGYVVDPSIQQPFTTKSLDFLQEGNKQMINVLCRTLITQKGYSYNTTVPYYFAPTNMPFPCDGSIFYNDELYIMSENYAGLDYCMIDPLADATADPLMFTDGVPRNVHNNRYLTFTNVPSDALFAISAITSVSSAPPAPSVTIYTATTVNSWIASAPIQYFIDEHNFVHLDGIVHKTGAIGSGDYICVLPAGYKPLTTTTRVVNCNDSGTKTQINLAIDASTGQVMIDYTMVAGSTDTYVWLQGVSFYKNW